MYLSEVFLMHTEDEFSEESVRKGIESCQRILEERLSKLPSSLGRCLYFLEQKGEEENPAFREMIDFWDVVKDFSEEYREYEIVRLAECLREIRNRVL